MLPAGSDVFVTFMCTFAVFKTVEGSHAGLGAENCNIKDYPLDANSNFTEIAANHGYQSEEHVVETEDGYILTVFRIPKGKNCQGPVKQPPVLLMHGLLTSSDSWLDAGPSAGLAYLLADACYDLWAGNIRGNYYGRRHIRLDPDLDSEFWRFSTDEMGTLDLPAIIDYMLNYTNSSEIMYVGFSQGGRIFFTMCSEVPEYCDRVIRIGINSAPAVRVTHTKSIPVKIFVETYTAIAPGLNTPSTLEAFPKGGPTQQILSTLCRDEVFADTICKPLLILGDSYDPGSVLTETVRILFDHFPGGTSAYTIAIYGQNRLFRRFQKYDYGPAANLERYGSVLPPPYNVSRVAVPVVLLYGSNDRLVDPSDVTALADQLPNVLQTVAVTRPTWNHFDNNYSQYVNETIFPVINQYLQQYSFVNPL